MNNAIAWASCVGLSNAILLTSKVILSSSASRGLSGSAIFESNLPEEAFYRSRVIKDLAAFKWQAAIIIANRMTDDFGDVEAKVNPAIYLAETESMSKSQFPLTASYCTALVNGIDVDKPRNLAKSVTF